MKPNILPQTYNLNDIFNKFNPQKIEINNPSRPTIRSKPNKNGNKPN